MLSAHNSTKHAYTKCLIFTHNITIIIIWIFTGIINLTFCEHIRSASLDLICRTVVLIILHNNNNDLLYLLVPNDVEEQNKSTL